MEQACDQRSYQPDCSKLYFCELREEKICQYPKDINKPNLADAAIIES